MEAEEEGAKKLSEVSFEDLPPNYHNESNTETRVGNRTVQTHQEIDKVWENLYMVSSPFLNTFSSNLPPPPAQFYMFIHKIIWIVNFPDDNYFGVSLYLLCLTSQGVKDTCHERLVWDNNLFWKRAC